MFIITADLHNPVYYSTQCSQDPVHSPQSTNQIINKNRIVKLSSVSFWLKSMAKFKDIKTPTFHHNDPEVLIHHSQRGSKIIISFDGFENRDRFISSKCIVSYFTKHGNSERDITPDLWFEYRDFIVILFHRDLVKLFSFVCQIIV